jgi:hypothetical protein
MQKYGEMDVNKYREMADSKLTKGLRILQREGIMPFLYKFSQYNRRLFMFALTPFIVNLSPRSYFNYNGRKLSYKMHKKSFCWNNERSIEVPIVMDYIKKYPQEKILEVGCVLPHYYPKLNHTVVDKFEKGKDIINEDVLNFKPKSKFDLVVSISTLEHVGYDDDVKDPDGTLKAINNLRKNCLSKKGRMVVTLPLRYNKDVDLAIFNKSYKFDEEYYYKRVSSFNKWQQISKQQATKATYSYAHANYIVVGVIKN